MRDDILANCVKEFSMYLRQKNMSHKNCTVLGSAWQKVIKKLKKSDIDTELEEAKAASANLKKRYQEKRATLSRVKKSGQGSKKVDKLTNDLKDSRVNENQNQILVLLLTYRLIPLKMLFDAKQLNKVVK